MGRIRLDNARVRSWRKRTSPLVPDAGEKMPKKPIEYNHALTRAEAIAADPRLSSAQLSMQGVDEADARTLRNRLNHVWEKTIQNLREEKNDGEN